MVFKRVENFLARWRPTHSSHWKWILHFLVIPIFVIALASLLYFREVRVEHLEFNKIADKYVLAKVTFEFPDLAVTRRLKEESLRDLGRIYCFNDDEVLRVEKKIYQTLTEQPHWRKELPGVTFEELLKASDQIRDILLGVELTDSRTISRMALLGQPFGQHLRLVYVPQTLSGPLPEEVLKQIDGLENRALDYMRRMYNQHSWTLVEDLTTQNAARQFIKDNLPVKMTKMEAGSRIINAGEKVTRRHLDMMKAMKKTLAEKQLQFTPLSLLGSLALAFVLTMIGAIYLRTVYPNLLRSFSKMTLIATIFLFVLGVAKVTELAVINTSLVDYCRYPIFVLFTTLILSILVDKGVAMIISGFSVMVLAISLAIDYDRFLVINLSAAIISLFLLKPVRKRKEIFGVCGKVWVMTLPLLLACNLMDRSMWYYLLADCTTTFVSIFGTGTLVVAVLPLLEASFGVVTDMTLMEAGDPHHPLIRQMSLEAPGTYQHSQGVAALAEEAALAIGANGIFCRVASLYHDIGKLTHPHYFIENQFSGFNMHQLHTPIESAQLIIDHVAQGVKRAQEHQLPDSIIDVIREHHGTGLVYYLFHAHMQQCHLQEHLMDGEPFRYAGPIPQSRESGIIMIADSVEAAYHSLEEISEKVVIDLVEGIVADKIRQHQLDAANLTLQEIEIIKKAMIRSLIAIGHSRPVFPKTGQSEVSVQEEELLEV